MNDIFPPRHWVRWLYALKGTGLPRLAELIRKIQAKRHPNAEIIIDDFGGDSKFACRLNEHMGSQIYWRGTYSGYQLDVLASCLRPGGVFIDLGANQGEFTVFAARLVGKDGRVFAFEPSPQMQQRLSKNIQLNNFDHVTIEEFAVADKPGRLSLLSPTGAFTDGTTHDGLPTLYHQEGTVTGSATEVAVTTLDQWQLEKKLDRVDLIKMDIEGAELPALQGGKELIQRFRPSLIIELNSTTSHAAGYTMIDLVNWLQVQDYLVFEITENGAVTRLNVEKLQPFQNILATPRL